MTSSTIKSYFTHQLNTINIKKTTSQHGIDTYLLTEHQLAWWKAIIFINYSYFILLWREQCSLERYQLPHINKMFYIAINKLHFDKNNKRIRAEHSGFITRYPFITTTNSWIYLNYMRKYIAICYSNRLHSSQSFFSVKDNFHLHFHLAISNTCLYILGGGM